MCLSFLHLPPAGLYYLLIKTDLISLLHSWDYWSGLGTTSKHLFVHCGPVHAQMFFQLLCLYFVFVLLPEARPRLVWSLLGSSRPSRLLLTVTHSWLIWILLFAGGTAACWGRNAAWHLWKRSWGSKGWVTSETQNKGKTHLHPLLFSEY